MQSDSDKGVQDARRERAKKRFIRWQGITRTQLGNVNNLLTGLAAGVIAFELQTIFRENLCLTVFEKRIMLASFSSCLFHWFSVVVRPGTGSWIFEKQLGLTA
jgi:hypothetical protein